METTMLLFAPVLQPSRFPITWAISSSSARSTVRSAVIAYNPNRRFNARAISFLENSSHRSAVIFHSKSSQLRPCRHVEACRFPLQFSVLPKSTCSTSLEHLVYGSSPSSLNSHFGFQHRYTTLPSRPIEPFPVNNPRDQWTNSSSQKSTATAAERLTKTLVDKIAEGIDSHEVFDNDIILPIPEEGVRGYVDLVSHLWVIAKLEARNGKRQA